MKSKFIKSTVILVMGGAITKLMAMIIKIFLTRIIGDKGISLYMLIMPTFNLFITLATLSLSSAISKLISEHNKSKTVIFSIIPFILLYNLFLMIGLIILAPVISKYLLKNTDTYYPIMAIAFTLPFISLSGILKGYFFGKEKMLPFVIANNLEQVVRLGFIIFIIPKFIYYGIIKTVSLVVLINIFSEFSSIICLLLFIPNKKISLNDFRVDKNIFKDILNISLSVTGSRLIGAISYFLEPIILIFIMLKFGYDKVFITHEYGIIMGYVFPLLLMPSFFTMAISTALLPVIANNYKLKNILYVKQKLNQGVIISFIIGLLFTVIIIIFPGILLKFIYNTSLGINYIVILAPFFLIYYIQGPLTTYLQAVNMAGMAMMGTLVGAIVKITLIILLCPFMGIWGFIVATISNIFYVTLQHIFYVRRSFILK